jgi:hypothetical protein
MQVFEFEKQKKTHFKQWCMYAFLVHLKHITRFSCKQFFEINSLK